jgi:hypothetical protein
VQWKCSRRSSFVCVDSGWGFSSSLGLHSYRPPPPHPRACNCVLSVVMPMCVNMSLPKLLHGFRCNFVWKGGGITSRPTNRRASGPVPDQMNLVHTPHQPHIVSLMWHTHAVCVGRCAGKWYLSVCFVSAWTVPMYSSESGLQQELLHRWVDSTLSILLVAINYPYIRAPSWVVLSTPFDTVLSCFTSLQLIIRRFSILPSVSLFSKCLLSIRLNPWPTDSCRVWSCGL